MQKIVNEQRMAQALRIIQVWATMAGSTNDENVLSWAAMAHEMDSIARLARETLEKCQQKSEVTK